MRCFLCRGRGGIGSGEEGSGDGDVLGGVGDDGAGRGGVGCCRGEGGVFGEGVDRGDVGCSRGGGDCCQCGVCCWWCICCRSTCSCCPRARLLSLLIWMFLLWRSSVVLLVQVVHRAVKYTFHFCTGYIGFARDFAGVLRRRRDGDPGDPVPRKRQAGSRFPRNGSRRKHHDRSQIPPGE